jgi:hypothetical protein
VVCGGEQPAAAVVREKSRHRSRLTPHVPRDADGRADAGGCQGVAGAKKRDATELRDVVSRNRVGGIQASERRRSLGESKRDDERCRQA